MKPWEVIAELESNSSRLAKERIIEVAAQANNFELFEGFKLALSSTITFGVKQVPEKSPNIKGDLKWYQFVNVVNQLINRTVTGNDASEAIALLMSQASSIQWNYWYRRILIKDLRCGVSEKTVNKIAKKHPQFIIPVFSVQLAQDSTDHKSKMVGTKICQIKCDGVRLITIVYPDGKVDQFSRNGKEIVNFAKIKDQFKTIANIFDEPMVFDGEIMSSNFQDLMRQVHRKSDVETDDAQLFLFDYLPLSEFQAGKSKLKQMERSQLLKQWLELHECSLPNINVLSSKVIDLSSKQGQIEFNEFNQWAIDNNYEGIMIKNPNAYYECKRGTNWLKLKPVISLDLKIIDLEEGTGRNIDRLGAFVCEGEYNGKSITVNVGSGFSDIQREQFWNEKNILINRTVEVLADTITQNQDGSYSLRFPRFKCFRGFEVDEKI